MNTNYQFSIDRIKKCFQSDQEYKEVSNKYIKLYNAIKRCIKNFELPENSKLPATRVLAEQLNLSRTTVVKSYELLLLENLISSKIGSGYKVVYTSGEVEPSVKKQNRNKHLYPEVSSKGKLFLNNISLLNRPKTEAVAFRPGLPPLDAFPINQWKKLLNSYWRYVKSSGLSYKSSTGIDPLRKSISNFLNISRNINCDYRQIIVVSGSLQSLYLISNVLLEKGDAVVVENPTFPNVHSIFKSMDANLLPIPIDDEGISIEKMNEVSSLKPKLIHVTPSNHYPLGIKMSLKRRKNLLKWASKNKSIIIENDYEHEIGNTNHKLPSLFSLDKEDRTIYIGTFNRLLHPSIRLGFLVLPEYLINAVGALQEHSNRFVAASKQVVMNQFIERNYLYKHLRNVYKIAEKRHQFFIERFNIEFPELYIENTQFQSLHLVVKFKSSYKQKKDTYWVDKLNKNGVAVYALSKCYVTGNKEQGFIVGFSSVRKSLIEKAIKKMVKSLKI